MLLELKRTAARGRAFRLVLSGGSTPRRTYELLAGSTRDEARLWERTYLYWGDERFVPHDDPRSNYRMAAASLLQRVPVPPENVHPIPTAGPDAEACAGRYGNVFPTRPDLMLLGMGADGLLRADARYRLSHCSSERGEWEEPENGSGGDFSAMGVRVEAQGYCLLEFSRE
jgi:hypothetical protein